MAAKRLPFSKWLQGFLACVAIFKMAHKRQLPFLFWWMRDFQAMWPFSFGDDVSFGDVAISILATRRATSAPPPSTSAGTSASEGCSGSARCCGCPRTAWCTRRCAHTTTARRSRRGASSWMCRPQPRSPNWWPGPATSAAGRSSAATLSRGCAPASNDDDENDDDDVDVNDTDFVDRPGSGPGSRQPRRRPWKGRHPPPPPC